MRKKFFSLVLSAVMSVSVMTVGGYTKAGAASNTAAYETAVASDKSSVYTVNVTYTPKVDTDPGVSTEMVLLVNGTAYTKALEALTAGAEETASFYVRLQKGSNDISVAASEDFDVTNINAVQSSTVTLEAETEAMGGGSVSDGRRQCLKTNPVQYIFDYPEGEYNIQIVSKHQYNANLTITVNQSQVVTKGLGWGDPTEKTTDIGDVTFINGSNTIKIETNQDNTFIDKIIITDIAASCEVLDGSVIRLEGEDYAVGDARCTDKGLSLSGGSAALSTPVNANIYANKAGVYKMDICWGNLYDAKVVTVNVNGAEIYNGTSGVEWWKTTVSFIVELKSGINKIAIGMASNFYVDYIEFSAVPTVTATENLRLEAEDYAVGNSNGWIGEQQFESGTAYIYSTGMKASFAADEAGEYVMVLTTGSIYWASPTLTVNINDAEAYSGAVGKQAETLAEGCVKKTYHKVTLQKGKNTIEIPKVDNTVIDYVEFSARADYEEEKYSYALTDKNIDGGRRWSIVSTYLGDYTAIDDNTWEKTKVYGASKALGNKENDVTIGYIYYPFTTVKADSYYLKITYASGSESDAVCLVDPTVMPSDTNDYSAVSESAAAVSNGKWQQSYSYQAGGTFEAPYFTEKYFNVGTLAEGEHNFVFMYDSATDANKGCSIRKAELVSAEKFETGLFATAYQLAAECVGEDYASSTAKLAADIAEANAFSSNSVNDADKNTAVVIEHIHNNSGEEKTFSVIAASYDDGGHLVGVDVSSRFTLANGQDADAKLKFKTNGATAVKTFVWDMDALSPVLQSETADT